MSARTSGTGWPTPGGARAIPDALEAVSDPELHGVAVCTPEHLHAEIALAALEAGKVVMVEKPLAHTVTDAERIRDLSAERGIPVLVGHILRFEPRYAAMARAIHEGVVGQVQAVRSTRIGVVSDQEILQGRTSIPLYYGVHEFDLVRWYAGEVERLSSERSRGVLERIGYGVEDLYSVLLRLTGGGHGTMMLGWSLPEATPGSGIAEFTVIGETGVLSVRQEDVGFLSVGKEGIVGEDIFFSPKVHGRTYGALGIEVDHFVRCVQGSEAPLCTATDGTEAVRLSLAMAESAEAGIAVSPTTLG